MLNRTLCDVLAEMRKCYETRNFSYLNGLVEEAQTMGNRMEAALYDQKEYERLRDNAKDLKEEIEFLKKEIKDLENVRSSLNGHES